MSSTPIAATAGKARERLAASLAALQQDPNVPAAVMDIVQGIARAIGPLFQIEKGADPALVFQARAALQETLGRMQQGTDQGNPAVADATAAIAQSLGMLFAAIREHNIVDPATRPAPEPTPALAPTAHAIPAVPPPVPEAPVYVPPTQPVAVAPPPPPVVVAPPPPPVPVPLVQPAQQPIALVQPAQQPVPLMNAAAKDAQRRSKSPTMFPETAARPQPGASGLPRLEAELGVHSESNFYTNFLGDITDHGGIFVATWAAVAIGTPCEVELQFPGDLRADVRGVVRWRRESAGGEADASPGLGVEITQANNEAWSLIKRFIGKRDPIIHDV